MPFWQQRNAGGQGGGRGGGQSGGHGGRVSSFDYLVRLINM